MIVTVKVFFKFFSLQLELGLLAFLKHKFEQKHRVSVERVVSGTGLANVRSSIECILWLNFGCVSAYDLLIFIVQVYEYLRTVLPDKIDASIDAQVRK